MPNLVDNNLLIHELQLGNQLNQCVHSDRRSDFALMLAMLTQDVREHSQFVLPRTSPAAADITDSKLRKILQLADPAPLAIENEHQRQSFEQAHLVAEDRMTELHLLDALHPKPLAVRDNKQFISNEVLTNMPLACQRRYHQRHQEKAINPQLDFDAKGWISSLSQYHEQAKTPAVHSIT